MPSPIPRISGRALLAARIAAETPGTAVAVREAMKRGLGITALQQLPHDARYPNVPLDARPLAARPPRARPDAGLPLPDTRGTSGTSRSNATIADLQRAFLSRSITPTDVAERALAALASLADRRPTMNVLAAGDPARARAEAAAATARYAAGTPLGPLDGIPVLIKDELDVAGLPTRHGSRCTPETPKERDAAVVARLRAAGAVILGKTVMTEWGMSPMGNNANVPMPRNPHHPERAAGGSSTGSAVAVALGVAPLAVGTDGGGSIRTPASLCGVFGIKPTYGRVSRAGTLSGGSVTHIGPIGATPAELAALLDAIAAAPDEADPTTAWAPQPPPGGFGESLGAGVRGLRIGVDEAEWRDASADVAAACQDALRALEREGAQLVGVTIPLARHAAPIGYLTIVPEVLAEHREDWLERRALLADDLRITLAVGEGITAAEHLDAQRLRARLREQTAAALRDVDVLALPTVAGGAPRLTDADAAGHFSDAAAIDALCRFAFLGNLTGLPAGTAPIGADREGVPVGLQFMGDAWDEPTVLSVLAHLARTGVAAPLRAKGAVDLLG